MLSSLLSNLEERLTDENSPSKKLLFVIYGLSVSLRVINLQTDKAR